MYVVNIALKDIVAPFVPILRVDLEILMAQGLYTGRPIVSVDVVPSNVPCICMTHFDQTTSKTRIKRMIKS